MQKELEQEKISRAAAEAGKYAEQERCVELKAQRSSEIMASMDGALLGYPLSWRPIPGQFPPRCGHGAASMEFNGERVLVVFGGVAHNEWHSSVFIMTGLSSSRPLYEAADSTVAEAVTHYAIPAGGLSPPPRRESAMCQTGPTTFLNVGGVLDDVETMDIWEATVSSPSASDKAGACEFLFSRCIS